MSKTMSSCEDSSCPRDSVAKCSNHCQLNLCSEHLNDHQDSFVHQYEKRLNEFHQRLNECLENVEELKITAETEYQRDLLKINENYRNKLNLLDEKNFLVRSTENLIKKKLQLLLNVKNSRAELHQYDFEQVQLFQTKINENLSAKTEKT